MDALRTTVRVFTQGAVVVATVTERLTAAMFHCAVDRTRRTVRPRGDSPSAHDGVLPDAGQATLDAKAGI